MNACKMTIMVALAVSALAAFAVDGWVADPYRPIARQWKRHAVKGRDFWHLVKPEFRFRKGVAELPVIRDAGTFAARATMTPSVEGFSRRICVRKVVAVDASGVEVPCTFELSSDEPGTTVDRGDGFTVLSAPYADIAVRYKPASGKLLVRAERPFVRVEIEHGTPKGSRIGDVPRTSSPAKIALSDGKCIVVHSSPVKEASYDVESPVPGFVMTGIAREDELRLKLENAPFTIFAPHLHWNSIGCPEGYVDRRGFEAAAARYPETYLGFDITEWDANFLQKINHGASSYFMRDLVRMRDIPTDRNGMVANMARQYDLYRKLFGDRLVAMSGGLNFQLYAGDFGASVICMETSGERVSASQRLSLMYTVSASRQFGVPSCMYIAYYCAANHPDSRSSMSPSPHSSSGTDWGMAPSLGTRNYYTYYYLGGNFITFESQPYGQIEPDDAGKDTWKLSANGRAIDDIYKWTRGPNAARGDCYAPILILEDRRAGDDQAWPLAHRRASFYGMFDPTDGDLQIEYMMRSISSPNGHESPTDPAGGTCHFNSSLGNVFNMALANPLRHGDIEEDLLARYSAVVVAGDLVWSETIANRVKRYVADGGTLVVTAGQSHPFDAEFLGAEFDPEDTVEVDGLVVCRASLRDGAKVLKAASNGLPLVTATRYGAGQVDLVLSPFFKKTRAENVAADDRFVAPAQVKEVLEAVQDAVLPIKVKGDCEFTVNRVDDGSWRVCLVNNLGSVKDPKSSEEKFLDEWAQDVTLTLPEGAKAEELRLGVKPVVNGREWTFRVPPAGVLVVKVDGVAAEAKGVQTAEGDKAYSPVKGFFRRFATTGRPNDGFRYDPARRMPKGKVPAVVGEWLAKNGFRDSSGNGHDMKIFGKFDSAEGAALAGKGSRAFGSASFPVNYTFQQGTVETWVKPSADLSSFKEAPRGAGRHGGVLFIDGGSIYVYYNSGRWACATVDGLLRRLDMVGPDAKPEWTHLAVTFDRELVRFYVNGREAVGEDGPLRRISEEGINGFRGSVNVTYGSAEPGWGLFFRGGLKGVRYLSRCLTADEIAARAKQNP